MVTLETINAKLDAIMQHLGISLQQDPEKPVALLEIANGDAVRSSTLKKKAERIGIPVIKEKGLNMVKQKDIPVLLNTKRNHRDIAKAA